MIELNKKSTIVEVKNNQKSSEKSEQNTVQKKQSSSASRPKVVDAKVYKVKSAFVKNSVFITLSYVDTENGRRPIEIFINSKDLNRAPEYVVLTRLISAIFRRATDPMFILEELHGIHDPNGGSFKEGRYYHSFYAEVAETIEKFFYDVGIISKEDTKKDKEQLDQVPTDEMPELVENVAESLIADDSMNVEFRICPACSSKSLKTENGCDTCMECGYSKCDK
jgi:ribonucleoside-diphosphate reductase alpha chain|tara:strand:+ start:1527 stop:2195 length:669 start_codon:yes stop_codon:yes gene_type:complete